MSSDTLKPRVHSLYPGADLQHRLQELLVQAVPGDVIEFGEGRFVLAGQIDIATDNITLREQGHEKTILSFKEQMSGGQGSEATGNGAYGQYPVQCSNVLIDSCVAIGASDSGILGCRTCGLAQVQIMEVPGCSRARFRGRAYDIVPGHPDKSILLYRMESDYPSIRMPSVGRNIAPAEAVALIARVDRVHAQGKVKPCTVAALNLLPFPDAVD